MLWRTGLLPLVLVFGQVLAEEYESVIVENVDTGDRASGQSRIVSGWEAYPDQFPYHAALRTVMSSGVVNSFGGALVSRQWVMTSARCTTRRTSIVVRLGVTDLTAPQLILESEEWYGHPTFDEQINTVQLNDIGLVKLPRRVVFTRHIQPILIQSSADAFRNYENEIMYISGHGSLWTGGAIPVILNWVYLRGISNSACQTTFPRVVNENTICARWFNVTSQSPCTGDGGTPLVHENPNGVPILVGVHSFRSSSGCHLGIAAGFVRPGPFHSWFTEITGLNFENLYEEDDDIGTTELADNFTTIQSTTTEENELTTTPLLTTEQSDDHTTTTPTTVHTTMTPTTEQSDDPTTMTPTTKQIYYPTTTIPTTEQSDDPTTVTPTTKQNDDTTTPLPTTEPSDDSTTTIPTTTEESEEDISTTIGPSSESIESEEQDLSDESDNSSDSESDEGPSGSVIKKKKKLNMKVKFKVKLEKEYNIEKIYTKKKHPARARLHLS